MAKGYTVDRVSSHSIHAGGAMTMKLSGATDSTIMRIDSRTSLTYLTNMYYVENVPTIHVSEHWVTGGGLRNQVLGATPQSHPVPRLRDANLPGHAGGPCVNKSHPDWVKDIQHCMRPQPRVMQH